MKIKFLVLALCLTFSGVAQTRLNIYTTDKDSKKLQNITIRIKGEHFTHEIKSDETGNAEIFLPKSGKYLLSAISVGFNNTDTIVLASQPEQSIEMKLSKININIDTVSIVGTKRFMQIKKGSIIIDPENNPMMNSSNLWEMLKQVPTVQTTESGMLTVRTQVATVYIDGRRVYMGGSELMEYLRSTPSNDVDRIEVIANPNSTFPSDVATVINIKSKKLKTDGYRATVGNSLIKARYFSNIASALVDFKKYLFSGQIGSNFEDGKKYEKSDITTQYKDDMIWDVMQNSDNKTKGQKYYLNLGYDINKNNKLTLYSELKFNKNGLAINSDNGDPSADRLLAGDSIFIFKSMGNGKNRSFFVQGTYDLSWDTTNQSLKIQLEYGRNRNKLLNSRSINTVISDNKVKESLYQDSLPNGLNTFVANTTYSKKILGGNMITGVRLFYNSLTNESKTTELNRNSAFVADLSKSSFKYTEHTYTLYSEWEAELNKFYYRVGIKLENNRIQSNERLKNLQTKINWFNILPSLLIQWDLNEKNVWNLSYKNTFTRPDYYQLNPFERFTDNSAVNFKGNQNIKPQNNHTIDVSWTNNGVLSASVGGQYLKNFISTIIFANENGNLYQQFDNFTAYIYYGNVNFNLSPKKWWRLLGTGNITYAYGDYRNVKRKSSSPLFDCRITNSFIIKNGWVFQIAQTYYSSMSDGYFKSESYNNTSLALQKKFTKPGITITGTFSDLFRNEIDRTSVLYNSLIYRTRKYNDTRFFRLSVSWNLGMQKIKTAERKESESEDAINRLKQK
ncbi:outer membrane beta-barrel protein [Sphingobacterium multivorum]|uniref:outer membrane beta-barrel protein n=1 Tax=Sphingobacterium multivorum TaxID=28454 RepID=UPI0028ABD631|nr:outer membrane beta-barrel protein [Sphingobacterium multivorum]